MEVCGLLGEKLSHSYSPLIHSMLGEYEYKLYEKKETEVEDFIKNSSWTGINVTIPYKKTVIPFMNSLSETAIRAGSVNTVIRGKDGRLFGDNTDVRGFVELVRHSGISVEGRKTLVLGNGGAAASIIVAIEMLGAKPVIISRRGENNYNNLYLHKDAEIIVNTTPLGMYPKTGEAPLDLTAFPDCRGVFDAIYNPSRTKLLLQAEKLGIPFENGLYMLVAQAKCSSEMFTGTEVSDSETERIWKKLNSSMKNIILIGMPGCGKSTVARMIGEMTGREVIDSDAEITKKYRKKPSEIILSDGEKAFRDIECEVISEIGKLSGKVISTGGGTVVREENYNALHQNGTIVWLKRDILKLASKDRPISKKYSPEELYSVRAPLYRRFADAEVDIDEDARLSTEKVLSAVDERINGQI